MSRITSWPGMYGGYTAPPEATALVTGRTPMFGADLGPRYTGPFNLQLGQQGGLGSMLQLMMPSIMGALMAPERMPAQFMPEQNLWDQMEATKFYMANQQAMQISSRPDTEAVENILSGIHKMMTGQELTERETARNFRMAETVSRYTPLLTQIFGPDMIDRLHGSRGSATVMAQQLHQAMRTSLDPITGRVGYTGESAGRVSTALFDELYGDQMSVERMRGMSAGQAGMLAEEMQARGMLGRPMGMMSTEEKLAEIPEQLTERLVSRLAEQLPEIRRILEGDGRPTEDQLATARDTVRATHQALRGGFNEAGEALSADDINLMPGGEEILRSADAQRIGDRLKNLSGAVKAMRDIFGDMGNPNAPMREIINGLEALTQGGLATMSPAALEAMVRQTHVLAKQTGVGVQGMMALMSQNAPLARQLGLDPIFAVTAAQQAVAFGAAAGDVRRLDMPAWGAGTKEQLILADQQLRMHAAAAPLTNNLAALMRMRETGMLTPRVGGELEALTTAIERGELEYEFQNAEGNMERREVSINRNRLQELLAQEGVARTDSMTILMDRFGNQEYAQQFNITEMTRRMQGREMVRQVLGPQMGRRFGSRLMGAGIQDILEAEGITQNQGDFRDMMQDLGLAVATDLRKLTGEQTRDPVLRRKTLGNAFRTRLKESVRGRMDADATDEDVEQMTATIIAQMGGEQALTAMGETIYATASAAAVQNPLFGSFPRMMDLLSDETFEQAASRNRQARATAVLQTAFSSLGTAGPMQRISDAIQNAGPDTTGMEILQKAMGGIDLADVAAHDPNGVVAELFGLMEGVKDLDTDDPEQLRQLEQRARAMKALIEGGDVAMQELRRMDASREVIGVADATQEQQDAALVRLEELRQRDARQRQAQLTNEEWQTGRIDEEIAKQADEDLTPEERNAAKLLTASRLRTAVGKTGDIDLGDGRVLTATGIQTRDAEGKVTDVRSLQNLEVQKEAVAALKQRQVDLQAQVDKDLLDRGGMSREDALKLAEEQGLIRGDLGYGTEELYELMQGAAEGKDALDVMRRIGAMVGAKVSKDEIETIGDYGQRAKELWEEDSEESREAVDKYVKTAGIRARQILADKVSMEQLGRGGLAMLQDVSASSRELQGLAQQESERLGRDVSIKEVIAGGGDISADVTTAAKKAYAVQDKWKEIIDRRASGLIPEEGSDMEMTGRERADLEAHQKFAKGFEDEETMAADVVDRLIGLGTDEQQDRMSVAENRQELLDVMLAGGQTRMEAADRAIRGREGIMDLAVQKGLFEGVENAEDLTEEQQRQALDLLEGTDLSVDEQADLKRMRAASGGLLDFGLRGLSPAEATMAMQEEMRAMPGLATEKAGGDAQEQKMEITLKSGKLTLNDDGTAEIEGEGHGIITMLLQTLGIS